MRIEAPRHCRRSRISADLRLNPAQRARQVTEQLTFGSPKRSGRMATPWERRFPYYAGYPEVFAKEVLASAELSADAVVFDPWNGSGTTTAAAASLGFRSVGFDINPVMVVMAKARAIAASEADALVPLAQEIVRKSYGSRALSPEERLTDWFTPAVAIQVRGLERAITTLLLGESTISDSGVNFDHISPIAATFFAAMFSLCESLVVPLRGTNPTWLRRASDSDKIDAGASHVAEAFLSIVRNISECLARSVITAAGERSDSDIRVRDASRVKLPEEEFDFVLTSPPYCTRIDYTSKTRIQLAVLAPLLQMTSGELSRKMMGSVRVPSLAVQSNQAWGESCLAFLDKVASHKSKASSGYYLKTHLDYYYKLHLSVQCIVGALKPLGRAVFIVQDSYYKEVHNDLPLYLVEMCEGVGLRLTQRSDFTPAQTMAHRNPASRDHSPRLRNEAVLVFQREVR